MNMIQHPCAKLPLAGLISVTAAVVVACGGGGAAVDPLAPAVQVDVERAIALYGIESSGVGGDASGDGGAAGAAGDGAALRNAMVVLSDAKGNSVQGTTDSNGKFLLKYKTANFTPPLVLRVIDAGGNILASVADESAATGKVHRVSVNPLTDKITSDVLKADVSGTDKAVDGSNVDMSRLAGAKSNLVSSVDTALKTAGIADASKFDPVKSIYAHDGNGVDAIIESISHTREPMTGVTQLRAKLAGVQTNADGSVSSPLITASTPLAASAVALPSNPALTFVKLNAWVTEINRCLALAPGQARIDANCIDADGTRTSSMAFRHNGKDLTAQYPTLFSNTDGSAIQGSAFSNPTVLFTASSGGSTVDDVAVVEMTINQPGTGPLAGSSNTPIVYTAIFVFRRDDKLTRAVAGNWILYGNQRTFDWSIEPQHYLFSQVNPLRQANVAGNSPSLVYSGLRLNFSPSMFDMATRSYKPSNVYAVRLTGPGLPSSGVVWAPTSNANNSFTILNKTGTIPSSGTISTNLPRDFRMGGAIRGSGDAVVGWCGSRAYCADASNSTDFSVTQLAALYKAEIYVTGASTPVIETARLTAPIQSPYAMRNTVMHNLAVNTAQVTPPQASSNSVTVNWTRTAGAHRIETAFTTFYSNGVGSSISTSVIDAFTLNPTSTVATLTNGGTGFPAQTVNDYREVGLFGRAGRAAYLTGLGYSP